MIQSDFFSKHYASILYYLFPFIFMTFFFRAFADHIFFFQEKSILFQVSSGYFFENLHQPGKLLIYLGEFLTTFYFYTLAGSVLVAGITCLIMIELSAIMKFFSGNHIFSISLLAGAALFLLQTNYQYLLFNSLGLLLQITFFYVTIRFLKGWLPIIIAPVWFFMNGGFSWVYFLMITFYFVANRWKSDKLKVLVLWLLCLAMIYVSKEFLFFQPVETLALFPFSSENTGSQNMLFLSVAAMIALVPLIARIKIRIPFRYRMPEYGGKITGAIFLVSALAFIAVFYSDKKTNHYFQVEKLFFDGKMDEVIAYNEKNPSVNILTNYLNNIALCEKGMLNDRLFHFRQSPDGQTLFLKWEIKGEILRLGGYFNYTTGMINEAQRWAYEYMVMKGPTPEGLKMLIKTELINGNDQVASKYISLLKMSMFYRGEAKRYERMLYNDVALNADPELGAQRRKRTKTDFFTITDNPVLNIERVLLNDSLNRNAFDYKIAWLLLNKDYMKIVQELPGFVSLNYQSIPVHVQEAAIAYLMTRKQNPLPDIGSFVVSRETEGRFRNFLTTFQQYNNDPGKAEPALRKQFGDTFWYYAVYR
jgi:hypothetical protein